MPTNHLEEDKPNGDQCIPYAWKRTPVKCPPDPDENVWGIDDKWILQFDNIMKHPGGRAKGCDCEIHAASWRTRGTRTRVLLGFTKYQIKRAVVEPVKVVPDLGTPSERRKIFYRTIA
ncbi:hypothetical protein RUM44_006390 [Polyplax serrata]|uniref:Uncharacterized protein n=1 Tax=Polyplax serrata TaxID=468196 RepID=A0ABR1AIP3_POLSC